MTARTLSPGRLRRGFTLVELLVVIAIIGILIALLMPAVNSSRESGRQTTCKSNLRNLGIGAKHHVTNHGFYPSSGWGYKWVGDPDRGYDEKQPGGWTYNLLAYIDQQNVRDIGKGLTGNAKKEALSQLKGTALEIFICPSRRRAKAYNTTEGSYNANNNHGQAKTDYAGNGGEYVQTYAGPGPGASEPNVPNWVHNHTGITHVVSQVRPAHIRDGESNTFWGGEKNLDARYYDTAGGPADNNSLYQGHDWDILRWSHSSYPPTRDRFGYDGKVQFGSTHANGAFFVFCDGSVHMISYSIGGETFRQLGARADGSMKPAGWEPGA